MTNLSFARPASLMPMRRRKLPKTRSDQREAKAILPYYRTVLIPPPYVTNLAAVFGAVPPGRVTLFNSSGPFLYLSFAP